MIALNKQSDLAIASVIGMNRATATEQATTNGYSVREIRNSDSGGHALGNKRDDRLNLVLNDEDIVVNAYVG